ncbi:hypothetical protein RRF57_008349 [Xylaria bambusicola]|uniref:Major facilitator superfamily (MFS) profile domain-containing protein n=1 Tax=Xylaria bambusicola TaxID=326684 RepID=A0AAN7UHL2_9PEZI
MPQEEERRRDDSLDEASELASLLPDSPRHRHHGGSLSISSIASSISSFGISPLRNTSAAGNATTVLYFITFTVSFSGGFIELPFTRLVEDILCHNYYDVQSLTKPIDESLCKEDSIQKELVYLLAVQSTLWSIVAFAAAFPWGLAADKFVPRFPRSRESNNGPPSC